ncbi:MAG: hypothetical protein RL748_32 [Pseudomonadota bacterium]|jgi:redox-sensitive bicupin YhaK (pirin superfamily)
MLDMRFAADRGRANFGWLDARHSFSFGHYFDPKQQGFSDLLVINEDRIEGGQGFDTHGHRDMEIFTYVLEGALEHRDSLGSGSVIVPGDVQMMSAGTGIRHSEFNHSRQEKLHLLQIWIVPDRKGVAPRYQETRFDPAEKRGKLRLIMSPDGADGSLSVYQDIKIYSGLFDAGEKLQVSLDPARYVYLHLARGKLDMNGQTFHAGDGARLRAESSLLLEHGEGAEILLFDMRANELPVM